MKKRFKSFGFISISLIGVSLFYLIPVGYLVYCSLINNPIQKEFVGLDNYEMLFQNTAFLTAVKNTVKFCFLSVPLAVIISLIMAIVLEKDIPGKSWFRTFFLTPLMVPTASTILIWQVLFCYNGSINRFLQLCGFGKIDFFNSGYGMLIILLLFLWKNLGYYMIIYMASLNEIPTEILEAATIDGGSQLQKFWYIKIRYLSPAILFVGLMALMGAFKIYKEVYLLVGPYPSGAMYLLQNFMNNTFLALDYQKLATSALVMTFVLTVIIAILFWVEDFAGKELEG